jgi:hypothetical protein
VDSRDTRGIRAAASPDLASSAKSLDYCPASVSTTTTLAIVKYLAMAPPPSNNRTLGPKESTLFKEVLNLYESRQLKKALKTADTILKKYPKHGGMVNASIWTKQHERCSYVMH